MTARVRIEQRLQRGDTVRLTATSGARADDHGEWGWQFKPRDSDRWQQLPEHAATIDFPYSPDRAGTYRATWSTGSDDAVSGEFEVSGASPDVRDGVFEMPKRSVRARLRRLKWMVGLWLMVVGVGSLIASLLLIADLWDDPSGAPADPELPSLLVLAAVVGATGSAGAALRSFIDRTGHGVEFDSDGERKQWPEAPEGTERFNENIVPGLALRPLLGAVIAPIAYAVVLVGSEFVVGSDGAGGTGTRQILLVLFIAGLFGMFAKSVWDNLNDRAKVLFKVAGK